MNITLLTIWSPQFMTVNVTLNLITAINTYMLPFFDHTTASCQPEYLICGCKVRPRTETVWTRFKTLRTDTPVNELCRLRLCTQP